MLVLETIVAFIITIAILVIAHEFGHYTAAKMVGVKVEEFALGFGPKLIRVFKRGDTEYTIHPIPAGGFVKLAGMEPGEDEDDPRGYNSQPIWKRFVIIFAGPFMSFALAYVIFCSLGITVGLPAADGVPTNIVAEMKRDYPAEKAGLRVKDRIIAIDGQRIKNGPDLQSIVHRSAHKQLRLTVSREGRAITLNATPTPETIKQKVQGKIRTITVGILGIVLDSPRQKYSLAGSIVQGTKLTGRYLQLMYAALSTKEGRKQIGGIVGITRVTAEGVKHGPDQLVFQLAALSLTLAIINILPWPILDGGHILLLAIEAVRRRKLSAHQMQVFQMFGLATLIGLALFLFYLDLNNWVPLQKPLFK